MDHPSNRIISEAQLDRLTTRNPAKIKYVLFFRNN
jgi:hypothetical protein